MKTITKTRYRWLKRLGDIYQILGILTLAGTLLSSVGLLGLGSIRLFTGSRYYGLDLFGTAATTAVSILLIGGLAAITQIAIGQAVQLLIDLEENTRETNALLYAIGRRLSR